jgi:folylpolyglutamate synthase/dihydropteroate synthase
MKNESTKINKKYLLLSIQKNKNFINAAHSINNMFDEIIYSKTSDSKSMSFSQIKSFLPRCVYIENPIKSIQHILEKAEKDDFIGIIGTHYWGTPINKVFNISFDNL